MYLLISRFLSLSHSESSIQRFNTSILVDNKGQIVGKYRKIHLPGHQENEPWRPFNT
jgi:predicted amidohydrolase